MEAFYRLQNTARYPQYAHHLGACNSTVFVDISPTINEGSYGFRYGQKTRGTIFHLTPAGRKEPRRIARPDGGPHPQPAGPPAQAGRRCRSFVFAARRIPSCGTSRRKARSLICRVDSSPVIYNTLTALLMAPQSCKKARWTCPRPALRPKGRHCQAQCRRPAHGPAH